MRGRTAAWISVVVAIACSGRIHAQTPCAGDLDADGDVDLRDFAEFSACLSGPGGGSAAGCACFDFDGDVDIDLADFALFSQGFTGPLSDCPAGQTSCAGTCVSTASDTENCGSCGNACAAGLGCQNGSCVPPCYSSPCGCADLMWDSRNCGGCGIVCPEQTACAWGTCEGLCIGCG